jgi:hypothetical protein
MATSLAKIQDETQSREIVHCTRPLSQAQQAVLGANTNHITITALGRLQLYQTEHASSTTSHATEIR